MHGRYEDITNVDFTLTEPSHMMGEQGRGRVANYGWHFCVYRVVKRREW